MYGASGDAHLRSEVSGACRGLSFVLKALWRSGRVYIYRHLRAELLQLARVVTRYVAVRGPGARLAWAFFARSERTLSLSSIPFSNVHTHELICRVHGIRKGKAGEKGEVELEAKGGGGEIRGGGKTKRVCRSWPITRVATLGVRSALGTHTHYKVTQRHTPLLYIL